VIHDVTVAMDQPTMNAGHVSQTQVKLQTEVENTTKLASVVMIGVDQTALTTKVNVERCVTDVTHQETQIVSTVSSTPIRTQLENAYVTHYGTLNGATFHTRPVP
jgi:hypothetical protein